MNKWKVKDLIDEYRKSDEFKALKPTTQKGYESYMTRIHQAFGLIPADKMDVYLARQYIKKRSRKVSANREISMLQTVYRWALNEGMVRGANPIHGVLRNKEKPRVRYVEDEEYREVWEKAPYWLQDAMDLCLHTGQRIGDVLKITRQDIAGGRLNVVQSKTGARLSLVIAGEFGNVLERILTRSRAVSSMYLIADDRGQRITHYRLWYAFRKCGPKGWRIHDIRAKAGSDMYDAHGVRAAQELMGHESQKTTESVYIRIRGRKVNALK